jgi:hypothetical protein
MLKKANFKDTCLKNDRKFILRGFISAKSWWDIYKSSYKLLKHIIYIDVPLLQHCSVSIEGFYGDEVLLP